MITKKKKNVIQPRLNDADDRYLSWLFIILVGAIPFLVRARMGYFTAPRIIEPLLNTGWHSSVFIYYKWLLVIGLAIAAIAIMIDKILTYHYKVRASYINTPLLILVILVLLSLGTADYKTISLLGLYDQWDGSLIFLAYLALFFVAANTAFKSWFKKGITVSLAIITIVNTIIILCHFGGVELLQFQFIKSLIAPAELRSYIGGEIWSTVGHANYISGLAAALFAYFAAGTLLENSRLARLGHMLLTMAAFAMILASLSSSGFVSVLITSPLLIAVVFLSRNKKQTLLSGGLTLLLCIAVFIAMNIYNPQVSGQTLDLLKNGMHLSQRLPPASVAEWTELMPMAPLTAYAAEQPGPQQDEFNLPEASWGAGTGRVYIWGETLKLIKARPLLGYGQGTLAYYFPQNDINNIAEMGGSDQLVSKAHNMYLDIAYGSGLPALLALLALFFLHFYHTGRGLWRSERNGSPVLPAALFLFFCTFAVQWLFNDMVVDSSAIFWTLMGAGVSLNKE